MTPTVPTTRPRVLLLTHRLPFPPDRGDRIRAYHLLRGLAARCDVTLASVCEESPSAGHLRALQAHAGDVLFQRIGPGEQRLRAAWAIARGKPATPAAHYHRRLAQRLVARHRDHPFDSVVTFCTGMAGYAKVLQDAERRDGTPVARHVLDLVDVDSAKWARYARASAGPMRYLYAAECRRLRAVERGELARFDALSVISHREQKVYARTVSQTVRPIVAGNGVDTDYFSPGDSGAAMDRLPPPLRGRAGVGVGSTTRNDMRPKRQFQDRPSPQPPPSEQGGGAGSPASIDSKGAVPTCVFTGVLSYKPNADAVAWFARRVLPLVREAVPGAYFEIVGRSPGAAVLALGELPGVRVVGSVPDTRPHLRSAAVAVAPLRIAPGVQNKVLEAMACATPVVCSPAAARGIDALPGRDLLVAGDARAFADAVASLFTDPARAAAIGRDARQRVIDRHAWHSALAPLIDTVAPQTPTPSTQKHLKKQSKTLKISRPSRAA